MNEEYEKSSYSNHLKRIEAEADEKHRFLDLLHKIQQEYPVDSLEYEAFNLAAIAITFSMFFTSECEKMTLNPNRRKRLDDTHRILREEYLNNLPPQPEGEDEKLLINVPEKIACLERLVEKYNITTDNYAALKCSLRDIHVTMNLKERFLAFLKDI